MTEARRRSLMEWRMKNSPKRNAMRSVLCIAAISSFTFFGCGDRLLLDDPRDLNIQVASPVFTIPAGVHTADIRVALTCDTPGAEIHYTVDGSNPTDRAPRFSGNDPFTISGNGTTRTIRAIAVKPRLRDSEVVTATYTVSYGGLGVPRFSPIEGVYSSNQNITISDDAGAVIHYTTDGSTPTAASPVYTSAIPLSGDGATLTLTAISCKAGMLDSSPTSATYRIDYSQTATPNFSPAGGRYDVDKTVTITCDTPGSVIHYTTDGITEPTASSDVYSHTISVSGDRTVKTIKAKAFTAGMKDSTSPSATYIIEYPVAAPVISPASFSTRESVTVTLTQSRSGATLYYTTDGSDPLSSTTRSAYSGPFIIPWFSESTKTVKAATAISGWSDSPVTTADYTFLPPKIYAGIVGPSPTYFGYLYTSENKGRTWSSVPSFPSLTMGGINDIEVSGTSIYVCMSNFGLRWSPDDGATWQAPIEGISANTVEVCEGVLYVGTSAGLFVGPPNCSSWTTYNAGTHPAAFSSNNVQDLLIEGSDLYIATSVGITMRKSGIWSHANISADSSENYVNGICRLGRFILVATSKGVFSSTNGLDWTRNTTLGSSQYNAIASYDSCAYEGQYGASDDKVGLTPAWTKITTSSLTWESSMKSSGWNFNDFGVSDRGVIMGNGNTMPVMKIAGHNWFTPGIQPNCPGVPVPAQITAITLTQ